MSKILKTTDRIPVKIDDITFKLAPLTYLQKMEIQDLMLAASQGDLNSAMKGSMKAIKYAVKDIKGVTDYKDEEFKLEFDDQKNLTDECVDNLLNLEQNNKLITVCASLLTGLNKDNVVNPDTGKPIEGISFGEIEGK